MSVTLADRREEFRELRDTVLSEFEALLEETQEPDHVGMLRSRLRYESQYDYGPFTVTLASEDEPNVKSVQFENDDRTVTFTKDSVPDDVLFGQNLDLIDHLPAACASVWDAEHPSGTVDTDALAARTARLVEMCNSDDIHLDDVITAFDDRNDKAIRQMFNIDGSLSDHPEVERLVTREGGSLRVHYQDGTLAVVSFWYTRFGDMRDHGGFVIGRDDTPTGLFVHEVDDENLVAGHEPTRRAVRRAMGFDLDLDVDSLETPVVPQRATRVQGDLKLTLVRQYETVEDAVACTSRARAIRRRLEQVYGSDPTARLLASVRLYEADQRLHANVYESYVNEATALFAGEFPAVDTAGRASINRHIGETVTRLCREVIDNSTAPDGAAELWTDHDWLNLPVDNHLLRFETGWSYPLSESDTEPLLVVVPQPSRVSITHNEHPEKRLTLDPGLYEIGLLNRGAVPDEFTAPAW